MDYASEQAMELEALEAILMDELAPYDGPVPSSWNASGETYKVVINPAEDKGESPLLAEFLFAHTPRYPEEPPSWRLRAVCGLSDADMAGGSAVLAGIVSSSTGNPCIYDMVTAAEEWLRGKLNVGPVLDPEEARRRAEEAEEAARAAKRAYGHPVTVESFLAWKAKFDEEMAAARKLAATTEDALKEEKRETRMTGRQWFMRDNVADELDEDDEDGTLYDAEGDVEEGLEEDDEDEDDEDYEDDDDDGMLDEYLAGKK